MLTPLGHQHIAIVGEPKPVRRLCPREFLLALPSRRRRTHSGRNGPPMQSVDVDAFALTDWSATMTRDGKPNSGQACQPLPSGSVDVEASGHA